MKPEIAKQFLTDTDHTGRFIVTSQRTGKVYAVEPIMGRHDSPKRGDLNPATKKIEGSYGQKFKGAVEEEESLITEENGFKNIVTLDVGTSPLHAIEVLDSKYPDKV